MVNGRQRYKCKQCRYHYTVAQKSDVRSPETRQLALAIYCPGHKSWSFRDRVLYVLGKRVRVFCFY